MKKPTPFGKYFLLERINVGGMAEVFRSKAYGVEGFERLVAVKRILPNIAEDKEFIRMFIEEAKLAVQLNHANIAQIFDLGVVDGAYYIALEHIHGRDLRGIFDRCRQLGEAMPVAQACFIAMKVCEGLDYAHNKRDQSGRELSLVHRDVSPQNILVSFEGEVKLIDFGIAKAAGTGAKTQAGILKGKFGYMSPEQVRGLAVDRRSDVFSCGIVLYELLTGERLFVGESDFSTLEKVRNVEILPPSTYNRKIPDELERIVLKALTKDVEDRYQNAIDLHDELQAFVYTAGEFYARKDLAGWMKKTFAKEIEEETAKLESYRQLKPPGPGEPIPSVPTAPRPAASKPPQQRKPTQPVPVIKPPPPPTVSRSQPVPVLAQPASGPVPVQAQGRTPAATPPHVRTVPIKRNNLSWDDDEIETQIYDGDSHDPKRKSSTRSNLPLQPPVSSSPGIALPAVDPADPYDVAPPPDLASGMPEVAVEPAIFPSGSNNAPSPLAPDPGSDPRVRDAGVLSGGRELSAPQRLVAPESAVALPYNPMASFDARITSNRRGSAQRRGVLMLMLGGAAVAAVAIIAVIFLYGGPRSSSQLVPAPRVMVPTLTIAPDPDTGFDLYVTPAGITRWKLDGESRTDRLPSRIRGIAAGVHTVQIEPPPGFLSQSQQVAVVLGKAPRVEITLQSIPGIVGMFDSTPPGATVSLIVDGNRLTIGPSPAKAPLDPHNTYQVLFEKPGYVSVNRPITFSGGVEERIVANLEKASDEPSASDKPVTEPAPNGDPSAPHKVIRPPEKTTPPRTSPGKTSPGKTSPGKTSPDKATPESEGPETSPDKATPEASPGEPKGAPDAESKAKPQGVLVLGSKPPCEITIDGNATGLHTPQKEIKLSVGRHRVTLTNSEFSIKETFTVDIKADAPEKMIKDYSDKLPD